MSEIPNVAVVGVRYGYGTRLTYWVARLMDSGNSAIGVLAVPAEYENSWHKNYSRKADAFKAAHALPGAIVAPTLWKSAGRSVETIKPLDSP